MLECVRLGYCSRDDHPLVARKLTCSSPLRISMTDATFAPARFSRRQVSIVVVNYHTDKAIRELLWLLRPSTAFSEIIVVDQEVVESQRQKVYRRWQALCPCKVLGLPLNSRLAGRRQHRRASCRR